MANYLTGAQRYNNRLHKIFEEGRILNAHHDAGRKMHAEQSHKGEYSSCKTCDARPHPLPHKQSKIHKVMHEFKKGKLRSGSKKGPEVTSRKQAIAIALSEARKGKK